MNDDSSLDGGRFDSGTMGDLDRMVSRFNSIDNYSLLHILFILG
jgi:hypothetical protein